MTSKPLKFFEETLPEAQFFRPHQSHMVQMRYVRQLGKGDDPRIEVSNGDRMPVARRKRDALVEWLAGR